MWQDIAFIMQALVETELINEPENNESVLKALDWLDKAQIRENRSCPPPLLLPAHKGACPPDEQTETNLDVFSHSQALRKGVPAREQGRMAILDARAKLHGQRHYVRGDEGRHGHSGPFVRPSPSFLTHLILPGRMKGE